MNNTQLLALDALAQADLVRRGEVSAQELTLAAIERIEALNPRLNAVIHPRFEQALEASKLPPGSGAFAGVPFLVKDLMCTTAGDPYHCGSRYFQHHQHRASDDTTLAVLNRHREFLPELFIVSLVTIETTAAGSPLSVSVRPCADLGYVRCPRCWRWVPAVQSTPDGDLCPRCIQSLVS